jgi:hypothetical protein
MQKWIATVWLLSATLLAAQAAPRAAGDPLGKLSFLEGTWAAKTIGGSASAASEGSYTFQRELNGHVLARHTLAQKNCSGPDSYNCAHTDLLYVYTDAPGQPLKAIFFDSEGHVIRYSIATPAPETAVFISDEQVPGPQFRLTYQHKGSAMEGRFEIRIPGQQEWHSYLEWTGNKQ